jgi:hypothetical protein
MELLHSGRDQAIREALAKHPGGAALLGEVDLFLERFGFLSANGTNFGEPTWAEDPTPLWMALGRMMREEPGPPRTRGPSGRRLAGGCWPGWDRSNAGDSWPA